MPEYKAVLDTVKQLTRPGRQPYTESERLTQRALLVGQIDCLVEAMERHQEKTFANVCRLFANVFYLS